MRERLTVSAGCAGPPRGTCLYQSSTLCEHRELVSCWTFSDWPGSQSGTSAVGASEQKHHLLVQGPLPRPARRSSRKFVTR